MGPLGALGTLGSDESYPMGALRDPLVPLVDRHDNFPMGHYWDPCGS